ncbi:MAG: alpha/beta fold hydrolase [Thermoflexibacter sp.]
MKIAFLILKIFTSLYLVACAILYFLQEKILFLPVSLSENYRYKFDSQRIKEHEEHFLNTENRGKINLVWFKIANPKGVILYCHGNAGNIQRWASIVDDLMRFGYDIILWDYRTYGKSTGQLNEKNLLSDAQAVYDFTKKHFSENQIIVYGRSLGTGMATYLSAMNAPNYLILETPYFNLSDVAGYYFPYFPYHLLLKYKLPSNEWITEVRCPITIFHGTYDRTVPYSSGFKLKSLLKAHDEFITIEGGDHNDLNTFYIYEEKLGKILGK